MMGRGPCRRETGSGTPPGWRTALRCSIGLLAVLATPAILPAPAAAQRVVVRELTGGGAHAVRRAVVQALSRRSGVSVVPAEEARGDEVALTGRVSRRGRVWTAELTVLLPSGEEAGSHTFQARSAGALLRGVRRTLWQRLGEAVEAAASAAPAPEPEPEPVDADRASVPADAEPEPPEPVSREHPSPLVGALGLSGFARVFEYEDDIFTQLRGYRLRFAPMLQVEAAWYPAAHFTDGFAAHLGIEARFGVAFGLRSVDPSGVRFPTRSLLWGIGARGRIPLGPHELGLAVGYAGHAFRFEDAGGDDPNIPSTSYRFIRIAADARIAAGPVGFYGRFGWLQLLGIGEIGSAAWFPRQEGNGVEIALGMDVLFNEILGVRATFEVHRYFFTLNPEPGDPWVAGGALDRYRAGVLWLLARMPGG